MDELPEDDLPEDDDPPEDEEEEEEEEDVWETGAVGRNKNLGKKNGEESGDDA